MDALLTAMHARGFKIYAQQLDDRPYSDHKYIYFEVLGERLGLRLMEKTRREERALTPDELTRQRKDKQFRPLNPWCYLPTGLFTLTILGDDRRERSKISDRKSGARLEIGLNDIVVAIVAEAAKQKHRREVAIENKRRAELEMRERWERQRIKGDQLRLLETLEKKATQWERAERLRAYANSMEKLAVQGGLEMKSESEITRRLEWIRHKADWLDPMVECAGPRWTMLEESAAMQYLNRRALRVD